MNGIAYHRIKQNLSKKSLAEAAGITESILVRYERNDDIANRTVGIYLHLSDALSVKVVDLIRTDYPDLVDRTSMMKALPSKGENLQNPIACYRRIQRLTYEELAFRLGRTTRECGRRICQTATPNAKHLKTLAAREHMTVQAFTKKYSKSEVEKNDLF